MLNTILVLITSAMLMGCVVSPDGWNANPSVGVGVGVDSNGDVDFTPRVHVGSRRGLSVWLHPNFVTADAYLIAQQHCDSFGTFARPARDWDIHGNSVRYLDYTCVSYRPRLGFPHIIVNNNRWYNRPWHRSWYNRRYGRAYRPGLTYTPKPRRNGWWTRSNRGRRGRSVVRPSKGRYRGAPVVSPRQGKRGYTPKPTSKRKGWWGRGSNVTTPSKSRYTKKYNSRVERPSKKRSGSKWSFKDSFKNKKSSGSKWGFKKSYESRTPKKEKYSYKRKEVTKKTKYSKKPSKVIKTEKKIVKTVKKPRKTFFKNKVRKSSDKRASKNRFKTL